MSEPRRRVPARRSTGAEPSYEVVMSRRGFDVRCEPGDQAVYFSRSRIAARIVKEALTEGVIGPRDAVTLPQGVADAKAAIESARQSRK